MKARIENGEVVKYNTIPKTLEKTTGETILKANTLSEEELKQLGFYDVVVPTYNNVIQDINNLHFDDSQECFVYDVVEKELGSLEDLKTSKIVELKTKANVELARTDWFLLRKTEKNIEVPEDVTILRDEIRSLVDSKEIEINTLTDKVAIITFDIVLYYD